MALVSVGGHDTATAIASFVNSYGLGHLPNLPDPENELAEALGISYHPRWLLLRAGDTEQAGRGAIPASIVTDALTPGPPGSG